MAGAEGMLQLQLQLQCVFDGSISGHHNEIDQRPYHRNCGCALHSKGGSRGGGGVGVGGCPHLRSSTVSYPIRRSWSEGSLSLASSSYSPASSSPSPNFYAN